MTRSFWKHLLTSPAGLFSVGVLTLFLIACIGAPVFAPFDPVRNNLIDRLQGPSWEHWLGTDALGRDILSRLLWGGRPAFVGVGIAIGTAALAGVPLGIVAGYLGGWIDGFISRMIDVALAIPAIIVLLIAMAVFPGGQTAAMVVLGLLFAPGLARIARAAAIATRNELFVAAARVAGLNHAQVLIRHIAPRIVGPVVIRMALLAAAALLVQAGLSFLGLGVDPPAPTWGSLVAEAYQLLQKSPWLIWPTGGTVTMTALALVILGDAIRDAMQAARSPLGRQTAKRAVQRDPVPGETPEKPSDALLSVEGLSVDLPLAAGPTRIVDDLSFHIRPGEILALVGESGCGKSVTAMSIIGMPPGRGRIVKGSVTFSGRELAGADAATLTAIRGKEIGFISQEPMVSLDPTFTVGAQVCEAVRRHEGGSRASVHARMIALLEQVQISDPQAVSRRYPHQISGGMAQRVVIARALAGRPRLLIADEPTTALDTTIQAEILDLIRDLVAELGMAVILVTHDWGVVADVADRSIVMYAGEAIEYGTAANLIDLPMHPYSQGLLRANPQLVADGERIQTIEGTVPKPGSWPSGCRFADRCAFVTDACRARPVPLGVAPDGRLARCIHLETINAERAEWTPILSSTSTTCLSNSHKD